MSDRLYAMLQKRLKVVSISGKLFDVTVAALKDAFDRAVNKAGLEDLHFHDLSIPLQRGLFKPARISTKSRGFWDISR
jgi:hypothetical protein